VKTSGTRFAEIGDRPLHLAVGMFDGLHVGHMCVIRAAVEGAKKSHGISGILTFSPHPRKVLMPEAPTLLLFPRSVLFRKMRDSGIQVILEKKFTKNFAQRSPEYFLHALKRFFPTLEAIYVGESFHFGHERSGNLSQMIALAESLNIAVFGLFSNFYKKDRISSTRIRENLQKGNLTDVNAMLGYTYFHEIDSTISYAWPYEASLPNGTYTVTLTAQDAIPIPTTARVLNGTVTLAVQPPPNYRTLAWDSQ